MNTDLLDNVLSSEEAELAKVAQRCIMASLDHSRAHRIALIDRDGGPDSSPALELPPKVLRFFAEMLGAMAEQKLVTLVPQKHELTTQEAAAFLNATRRCRPTLRCGILPASISLITNGRDTFRNAAAS